MFKVVDGRLSESYNHFQEFELASCQATNTRLMGVVALKITWNGITNKKAHYYQVIHLDYSEYGFDDYYEFDCTPGISEYEDNLEEMEYFWKHFLNVMGGKVINIKPDVMLRLIETAMPLADKAIDREYDNEENQEFRLKTMMRLNLMIERLAEDGITSDSCDVMRAIQTVSPSKLTICETMNYFLMRLIDLDFQAASCLSSIPISTLRQSELTRPGIQTLIRSNLKMEKQENYPASDGKSYPYRAKITSLGRDGYYHSSLVIYLDGDYTAINSKVTDLELGSMVKLSEFESALQVAEKEYITVFHVPDRYLNDFDGSLIPAFDGAEPTVTENGWLFTIYNKDNKHVNTSEYRLDGDVFGYAILTIPGELVLMARKMDNISKLDTSVQLSFYGAFFGEPGRYLLERSPVFHTLCHTQGLRFEELVVRPE